jgi:hypothetical protein
MDKTISFGYLEMLGTLSRYPDGIECVLLTYCISSLKLYPRVQDPGKVQGFQLPVPPQ